MEKSDFLLFSGQRHHKNIVPNRTLYLAKKPIKSAFLRNSPYDETNSPYRSVAVNVILRKIMKN